MNLTKTLVSGLVLVPLVTAAAAHADEKVISGSACSARHPETDNVLIDSGGIEAEAANISVYCPLVRDNTTGELGSVGVGFTEVVPGPVFIDRGTVTCDLIARNIDDSGVDTVTANGSLLVGGGTLLFDTELADLTEGTDRMYTVKCILEDGDVIGGIYWNE